MLATELIKQLQSQIDINGDAQVFMLDRSTLTDLIESVNFVRLENEVYYELM